MTALEMARRLETIGEIWAERFVNDPEGAKGYTVDIVKAAACFSVAAALRVKAKAK